MSRYISVWDVRITEGEHAGRILTMYGQEGTTALLVYPGEGPREFLQVPVEYLEGLDGTDRPYWRVPALA